MSLAFTVPTGGRSVKLTLSSRIISNNTSGSYAQLGIWNGTVGSGTRVGGSSGKMTAALAEVPGICIAIVTPSAGSYTYNASLNAATSGTATFGAISTEPAYFMAELI